MRIQAPEPTVNEVMESVMIVMPYMMTNIFIVFLYLYLLSMQICNCAIIMSA